MGHARTFGWKIGTAPVTTLDIFEGTGQIRRLFHGTRGGIGAVVVGIPFRSGGPCATAAVLTKRRLHVMGATDDVSSASRLPGKRNGAGGTRPTPATAGWVEAPDGVQLYWRGWLPAAPPTAIVAVHHGICEHGERYPNAVRVLVDAGYGVYALDARGHGRSEGRPASYDRFAQLVADLDSFLVQVVRPASQLPTYLLGYSLGGAVAVAHAISHQDELAGAIVIGSALGLGSGVSRVQYRLAAVLSAVAPRCPLIRLRPAEMTSDAEVVRSYEADPLIHHGRLDARFLGEMAKAIRSLPLDFHRLRLPLLLIHGADDVIASPEGSRGLHEAASSADNTLILYPNRRHDVLNEPGHEQVMADIVAWLRARL
jgi:acylglycerol lipase